MIIKIMDIVLAFLVLIGGVMGLYHLSRYFSAKRRKAEAEAREEEWREFNSKINKE